MVAIAIATTWRWWNTKYTYHIIHERKKGGVGLTQHFGGSCHECVSVFVLVDMVHLEAVRLTNDDIRIVSVCVRVCERLITLTLLTFTHKINWNSHFPISQIGKWKFVWGNVPTNEFLKCHYNLLSTTLIFTFDVIDWWKSLVLTQASCLLWCHRFIVYIPY